MNGVSIRGIKINDTSACCMRVVRLSKHTISIGISTTVVLIKGGGGQVVSLSEREFDRKLEGTDVSTRFIQFNRIIPWEAEMLIHCRIEQRFPQILHESESGRMGKKCFGTGVHHLSNLVRPSLLYLPSVYLTQSCPPLAAELYKNEGDSLRFQFCAFLAEF